MTGPLPMVIEPPSSGGLPTPLPETHLIPALVANENDAASWRYIDFFISNIRNPNTAGRTPGRVTHPSRGARSAASA